MEEDYNIFYHNNLNLTKDKHVIEAAFGVWDKNVSWVLTEFIKKPAEWF